MNKTNEPALRVVTHISRRHFCNPVCGESKETSVLKRFYFKIFYILPSFVIMPSTHDWINNPLGVVEGMFGKKETGTLHQSLTAKR